MKKLVATFAVCAALATPALAGDAALTCDSATIAKLNTQFDAMVDPAVKDKVTSAKDQLAKAQDALKAKNTEDCMAALRKAVDELPKPTN